MSNKKEKLYKYLKERKYFELEEGISDKTRRASRSIKQLSERQEKKQMVNAIKRFQTFSGLPATGRVNKSTLQETERPRCGFPDITAREILTANAVPPRWNTPNITYGFRNFTQQLPIPSVRNAMATAFGFWKMAVPVFNFREIPLDENPLIIILFAVRAHGDGFDFQGVDSDLAHAFLPNSPVLPGDIHFDNEEQWSLSDPPIAKDFLTVAIHEIGHSLGLVHSTNPNAQMFATYQGLRRGLHQEDVARIRNLYS